MHIWQSISAHIQLTRRWEGADINQVWEQWFNQHRNSKLQSLPIIIRWYYWLARNRLTFEDKEINWPQLTAKIIAAYNETPDPVQPKTRRPHDPPHIDQNQPWAFFDGAAQPQGCGGGFLLYKNPQHIYKAKLGLGAGSNNFAELITLRHLFHFALNCDCSHLNIYMETLK